MFVSVCVPEWNFNSKMRAPACVCVFVNACFIKLPHKRTRETSPVSACCCSGWCAWHVRAVYCYGALCYCGFSSSDLCCTRESLAATAAAPTYAASDSCESAERARDQIHVFIGLNVTRNECDKCVVCSPARACNAVWRARERICVVRCCFIILEQQQQQHQGLSE